MYKRIMVPVDLAHLGELAKALQCAGDLAKLYGAEVTYVGVTASTPGSVAHNPEEYREKLLAFATEQAEAHGITAVTKAVVANDPTSDVANHLIDSAGDLGADLVVMASHVPGVVEYIWPSNGGKVAEHAKCSVMVVRG